MGTSRGRRAGRAGACRAGTSREAVRGRAEEDDVGKKKGREADVRDPCIRKSDPMFTLSLTKKKTWDNPIP